MTESPPSENHRLLVATRNAHKVREIREILGPAFTVCDLSVLPDLPPVEETGATFEDNATLKAVAASKDFDGWTIADDSGLEVDALDGEPGVRSARYAGDDATDAANNALLLRRLNGVPTGRRTARFRCLVVLARAGRKLAAFSGTIEGVVATQPAGEGGFGYDPLFIPVGHEASFAQLPPAVKNALSHRSQALRFLSQWKGWF